MRNVRRLKYINSESMIAYKVSLKELLQTFNKTTEFSVLINNVKATFLLSKEVLSSSQP